MQGSSTQAPVAPSSPVLAQAKKTLLVIAGSSILSATPESAAWAKQIIDRSIASIGPRDLVFSGDNSAGVVPNIESPDVWIRNAALEQKRRIVEFRLDGFRYFGGVKTAERWHDPFSNNLTAELERFELFRNDKLIEACSKAFEEGWDIRAVFLLAKEAKNRFVSVWPVRYLLQRIESIGADCEQHWLGDSAEPEISEGPQVVSSEEIPIVWVDLETGGRNAWTNAITEVGCVLTGASGERIVDTFERKVMPHHSTYVEAEAARITGFSMAGWRAAGAISERDMLIQLIEWLPKRFVWGGYNAHFDRRFLQAAAARHGLVLPAWIENKSYDPLVRARAVLGKSNLVDNCQLGTVCKFYGIVTRRLHSALSDAESAWQIWLKLKQ